MSPKFCDQCTRFMIKDDFLPPHMKGSNVIQPKDNCIKISWKDMWINIVNILV